MKICSIPGCGKKHRAKGFCTTHWQRQAGYIAKPMEAPVTVSEQRDFLLAELAAYTFTEACREWPYAIGTHGYGALNWEGQQQTVPRIVCTIENGYPDEGEEVLHSCHNRKCWNPKHLRWGSRLQNVADSIAHGTFCYPPGRYAA